MKSRKYTRTENGFTLTEMMVVIAIIIVLSVIAIPSYIGARRAYREQTAIKYLRQVGAAANTFRTTSGTKRFPYFGEILQPLPGQAAPLVPPPDEFEDDDHVWVSGWYIWPYSEATNPNTFAIVCEPGPDTGSSTIYALFEDGVVRYSTNGLYPTRTSPAAK